MDFVNTIPSLVWQGFPDGSIEFQNQRWIEYTGCSLEEGRGWGWTVSIHPEDLSTLLVRWRAIVAAGAPGEGEARLRSLDGSYRWFLFRMAPARDRSGGIAGWCGTATDIDSLKQAEVALRRSESYLAEAERLSHTGSWAYDIPSGVPVYWSLERCRISGFDPAKGHPTLEEYRALHTPEDWMKLMSAFDQAIRDKADFVTDSREILADGTVKYLHIVGHPMLDSHGKVVELVGSTMDVTERKRTEETLRKAQENLAQVTRLTTMGELTASIAHEVNQPLAAMVTNANACLVWLDHESPNLGEVRDAVRRIIRDGKRGSDVIARIRALLRQDRAIRARMSINEVIRETISLTRVDWQGVTLRTELGAKLPRIFADRVQIQQVLLNLMSNAVEALRPVTNRPRVLHMVTRSMEKRSIEVIMQDTGVGLDPGQTGQLFDAFYTTKPGGLGMGLSISRSIVAAHGGRLWAEAGDEWGAKFIFTLPVGEGATS